MQTPAIIAPMLALMLATLPATAGEMWITN